jgi:hypothetical protein
MEHRFTRRELYDRVWSKPMSHLVVEVGTTTGNPHAIIASWLTEHEQKKRRARSERDPWRRNLCDPGDFSETDHRIRIGVQLRHRHVLVDEYQDVNRASARLLKTVAGDGERLWVVGHARQSIYRFRGASSENIIRFATDYSGAVIDQLCVNYRSTEQIVRSFVAVAPPWALHTAC